MVIISLHSHTQHTAWHGSLCSSYAPTSVYCRKQSLVDRVQLLKVKLHCGQLLQIYHSNEVKDSFFAYSQRVGA